MWKIDAFEDLDFVGLPHREGGADEISKAIDGTNRRVVERRYKKRTREMCRVMFDEMKLRKIIDWNA
jgi:hypothetical protein